MRLVLFVEGDTEKRALPQFLKRWLDPQLDQPVRIAPVQLNGSTEYLGSFAARARRFLAGNGCSGVLGRLDYYGSGLNWPHAQVENNIVWARQRLEAQVGHERFRQHFAVHETEAWLFSDPDIFPREIRSRIPRRPPEEVNLASPPSRILSSLYWDSMHPEYRKVTDATELFGKLDPQLAARRCPRLQHLLDDLLHLAAFSRNSPRGRLE